jgi:ribosomal protein L5
VERTKLPLNLLSPTPKDRSKTKQNMNPLLFHKEKQKIKLLSSKFIYTNSKQIPKINKLRLALLCSGHETTVTAATATVLFGQKPTFTKSRIARTQNFRLQQVVINASGLKATRALFFLSRTLLPFQEENHSVTLTPTKQKFIT